MNFKSVRIECSSTVFTTYKNMRNLILTVNLEKILPINCCCEASYIAVFVATTSTDPSSKNSKFIIFNLKKLTSPNDFWFYRLGSSFTFWQFLIFYSPLFQTFWLMKVNWFGSKLSSTNVAVDRRWDPGNFSRIRNNYSERLNRS